MAPIRRIVIDILKPHDPTIPEVATKIADISSVEAVNIDLLETDREVQNIIVTVEGTDVEYDRVKHVVDRLGGSIHSVDQILCGERALENGTISRE